MRMLSLLTQAFPVMATLVPRTREMIRNSSVLAFRMRLLSWRVGATDIHSRVSCTAFVSCTYYVPLCGDLSGSAGLERRQTGLNVDVQLPKEFDSRRLHHLTCSTEMS